MLPKYRKPAHPGEILLRDFLEPYGLTQKKLADHLGCTYTRINEIINGHRGISADTALALSEAFSTDVEFWMNLQNNWALWQAKAAHQTVPFLDLSNQKDQLSRRNRNVSD